MIRKIIFAFLLFIIIFSIKVGTTHAIVDPLSVPNNKFGIHILFPDELSQAANLVNSNNGDWGYVTIPIQAGDRDLVKWQNFMNEARALHLIPIIRLTMVSDYTNTNVWQKPNPDDVLDFANFLNSLYWPTQNRYVVIFNEPNRNSEWGGGANPKEYADILDYAIKIFKTRNQNFFIISAGLDNGADTGSDSINEYDFIRGMADAVPDIFDKIDGWASHSYPNPGFCQPPWVINEKSIASFEYERELVESLSSVNRDLPIFITETGWSQNSLSDALIASYYSQAFSTVWADKDIVAITPFLLDAGSGPFKQFSFLDSQNKPNFQYDEIRNIAKIEGKPVLAYNDQILEGIQIQKKSIDAILKVKNNTRLNIFSQVKFAKNLIKWFLNI